MILNNDVQLIGLKITSMGEKMNTLCRIAASLMVIASVSLFAACAKKPYVEYEASTTLHYLKVGEPKTRYRGDLLQFATSVTNKESERVSFQYKVTFYDKSNFELNTHPRPWIREVLGPKETRQIQVTSPDASAFSAKIYIKK